MITEHVAIFKRNRDLNNYVALWGDWKTERPATCVLFAYIVPWLALYPAPGYPINHAGYPVDKVKPDMIMTRLGQAITHKPTTGYTAVWMDYRRADVQEVAIDHVLSLIARYGKPAALAIDEVRKTVSKNYMPEPDTKAWMLEAFCDFMRRLQIAADCPAILNGYTWSFDIRWSEMLLHTGGGILIEGFQEDITSGMTLTTQTCERQKKLIELAVKNGKDIIAVYHRKPDKARIAYLSKLANPAKRIYIGDNEYV